MLKAFLRELADSMRLFEDKNKELRRVVFYSERDIYYQYYEGLIDYLLANSAVEICYATSDLNDPIFKTSNSRIKPFYVKHCLGLVLSKLDAKVVVMTMPDLNNFFVSKGESQAKFLYKFHAMVSTHQQYRNGAFDHYDAIFCVGPHQVEEIRRRETMGGITPKHLVESGYHRLEAIYQEHAKIGSGKPSDAARTVLVAPTWGDTSLFEAHLKEIVSAFAGSPFNVHLRPHPQSLSNKKDLLNDMKSLVKGHNNIHVEGDLTRKMTIHQADVLVTDRSGIAFEYAFGTERPVLFIDTPLKVSNPQCSELGIEPIENRLRHQIGVSLNVSEINRIADVCRDFLDSEDRYRSSIIELRSECIFNWLESSRVEGDYILGLL
ncbi:MAG: CDP-glycerol glycerophosphotransferase family protein [Candidatus Obscuribacterales bacterium]|nr:CDP-glycerol glycerophosphotransferase family protein [Candidatus Obscuribacterales bacterium]